MDSTDPYIKKRLDAILSLSIEIAEAQRLTLPKGVAPSEESVQAALDILQQVERGPTRPNLRLVQLPLNVSSEDHPS